MDKETKTRLGYFRRPSTHRLSVALHAPSGQHVAPKNLIALKPLNLSTNSFSSSSSTEPRDAATTSVVQEAPGTSLALTPPVNARRVSA